MIGMEGSDGRIYFHYAVGQKFEIVSSVQRTVKEAKPISEVEIIDCSLDKRGREIYTVIVRRKKREEQRTYSHKDLDTFIQYSGARGSAPGNRKEIPLLASEVKIFFDRLKSKRKKALEAAKEALKAPFTKEDGTIDETRDEHEFEKLEKQKLALELKLSEAVSKHDSAAEEDLREEYSDVIEKWKGLILERGQDLDLFLSEPICPICNNEHFVRGEICECAINRTEEIKAFNADVRIKKRIGNGVMDWVFSNTCSDEAGRMLPVVMNPLDILDDAQEGG